MWTTCESDMSELDTRYHRSRRLSIGFCRACKRLLRIILYTGGIPPGKMGFWRAEHNRRSYHRLSRRVNRRTIEPEPPAVTFPFRAQRVTTRHLAHRCLARPSQLTWFACHRPVTVHDYRGSIGTSGQHGLRRTFAVCTTIVSHPSCVVVPLI